MAANLERADLSDADLGRIRMIGTNLKHSKLLRTRLAAARLVRSSLKGADLTAADLTNSSLMRIDVAGADLTDVILSGARAGHVDWSTAKAPPAELPESLPTPPPWLPVLLGGISLVILMAVLRQRARQRQ
jgi:uncharacterized protein YjbI with pentapeptide repeats